MALSYNARKKWALVVLLVGLPVYILAALWLVSLFERPNMLVEFGIYLGLGIIWALPFRFLFKGIGQADPDARD
ncbi:MAG: DUF2842 domain-containing protein [Rubellimicrobium sp.]|nr:DUF2842 domain-containing protein [Rubellimicrobium sp.]